MRLRPLVVALALLTLGPIQIIGQESTSGGTHRKPNVVLIVVDDLGYGELGCYGGREIPTPQIDRLATEGVRFTDGYVTAPFCAASRAALMTGRYQTRFGFEFNPIGAKNLDPRIGLPVDQITIADVLRESGYATGAIGKWHLGGTAPYHPLRRGFDTFYGFLHEGHFYLPKPWSGATTWLRRKSLPNGDRGVWVQDEGKVVWSTQMGHDEPEYDTDNPILRNQQPIEETADLTTALTREATEFITRHRERPFFLYLSYNAVHSPMQGMDAYMEKFASIKDLHRRVFAAMLGQLDDSIGQVMRALESEGLDRHTMVVLLSDNGGPTQELTSRNDPLRGGKGDLYEGGIRVPFVMRWPDGIAGQSVIDSPVSSMDLFATLMQVAGIEDEPAGGLDGRSLVPLVTLGDSSSRSLYWRLGRKHALRQGRWKLIRQEPMPWQLYDLATDVGETTDQSSSHVGELQRLSMLWEAWSAEQKEPLWQ